MKLSNKLCLKAYLLWPFQQPKFTINHTWPENKPQKHWKTASDSHRSRGRNKSRPPKRCTTPLFTHSHSDIAQSRHMVIVVQIATIIIIIIMNSPCLHNAMMENPNNYLQPSPPRYTVAHIVDAHTNSTVECVAFQPLDNRTREPLSPRYCLGHLCRTHCCSPRLNLLR